MPRGRPDHAKTQVNVPGAVDGQRTPVGYDDITALRKRLACKVEDLLALSRDNDPFFSGTPAHVREAEWFADLWREHAGVGAHIRRLHYRLINKPGGATLPDGSPYVNDSRSWATLARAAKHARHLGLVDPTGFVDRRNTDVRIYAPQPGPAPTPGITWSASDGFYTPHLWLPDAPAMLSTPSVYGYEYDYTEAHQPVTVEVWVEKSGVDDVLDPICVARHVNLLVGTGYESITQAVALLRERTDRPVRILYLSDYDPAGRNMPVAVARHAEFYVDKYAPDADVQIRALALTADQIATYDLPHAPGDARVELDALEALRPGVLRGIVEDAIGEWRDETLSGRLRDARIEATQRTGEAWAEQSDLAERIEAFRDAVQSVHDEYACRVAEWQAELDAAYEPLRAEWEEIAADAQDLRDDFDVDLPERPAGEVPEVDTSDWLFDSRRSYFDQLAHYKRHKNGTEAGSTALDAEDDDREQL